MVGKREKVYNGQSEQSGSAMVEFALTLPVVLFFVYGLIHIIMAFYGWSVLKYAVNEASYYAILGVSETNMTRLDSIKQVAIEKASDFGVALDTSDVRVCLATQINCANANENAGTGGNFIWLSAMLDYSLIPLPFMDPFDFDLEAEVITQNEPFL